MATYVQTADDSDLSPSWTNTTMFDKDIFVGAATPGNFQVAIPGSSTRSGGFITLAGVPNNDDWSPDSTSQTVELDVSMGDTDFVGDVRIVRLNSAGVIQEAGAFTGTQVLDQSRTFSPVSPVWTAGACSDRLAIELRVINNDTMSHNLKLNIRVTTAEVITDIPEDVAACVGAAAPKFINQGGEDLD